VRYDDMMGLEMYGGEGLGAMFDAQGLKESLMSGAVGAGGIILTASVLGKITQPATGMFAATPPADHTGPWNGSANWRRLKGVLATAVGVLGGRALESKNRDAAMAFTGAVAGMGLADLIVSWIPAPADGTAPMIKANLAGGYLSGADLRALEAAVATPMAAWRPNYDMNGLGAPMTQTQMLRSVGTSITELGSYAPYLS